MPADQKLEIIRLPVLQDNYVWLVREPLSSSVAVVDPAVVEPVMQALDQRGWKLTHILNTHHHADHVGGNLALKEWSHCTIVGPKQDAARIPGIDVQVDDGDSYDFGRARAQV